MSTISVIQQYGDDIAHFCVVLMCGGMTYYLRTKQDDNLDKVKILAYFTTAATFILFLIRVAMYVYFGSTEYLIYKSITKPILYIALLLAAIFIITTIISFAYIRRNDQKREKINMISAM